MFPAVDYLIGLFAHAHPCHMSAKAYFNLLKVKVINSQPISSPTGWDGGDVNDYSHKFLT